MCKTTTRNQTAAAPDVVRTARRTPGGGGPSPQPANAFRGLAEHVPEIAFVRERAGDGFLTSAKSYYTFFGIDVVELDSIEQVVLQIANYTAPPYKRIAVVSHAHPRGMLIPFFTNGVKGTNKDIFREFAKSDLDGLKLLSPFEMPMAHLFNWNSVISGLMALIRSHNAASLQPFGLQASGNPTGDLLDFVKFAFDIVYLRDPGRVKRNPSQSSGLSGGQRTILENFVGAILNELKPRLATGSVTSNQVDALRSTITGITYGELPVVDAHPHLGLDDDNMNDFPTLQAVVHALDNGFRLKLTAARTKLNTSTVIDIRGCRAGQDADYVEAIREFFGSGAQQPMVTAPRHFQGYPKIGFQPPASRADITSWLGASHWGHSSAQMKQRFTDWAELIRVRPLHYDFWLALFRGTATAFGALGWRSQIPALFIPTPGVAQLTGLDLAGVIGKVKDYFNVPAAKVPSGSVLSGLSPVTSNLAAWLPRLMPPVADSLSATDRTTLFAQLNQIDTALGQTLVPDTSPNGAQPPTAAQLRGYQTALLNHLETTSLTSIKTFMTAAADSLESGDGLHYYMLFAGLPVFVFGTPELSKNGLVVLNAHKGPALQSWYKCLWKEPLPSTGAYTSASIGNIDHRQVAALVGEDRTSLLGICPMPKYMQCIRKRPLPAGDDESLC